MHYVNGALALVLVVLSVLHLNDPKSVLWMSLYGAGAILAAASLKATLSPWTVRVLATAATVTMFLYFAGFFFRAPYLGEAWYTSKGHGGTLALLVAGFCMMPIVSAYSCRMKALHSPA
jgi:hypothetical protein